MFSPCGRWRPSASTRSSSCQAGAKRRRGYNAEYAISRAQKAGCAMFLGWRDIVQVQPRMILCLFAAAMSLELRCSPGAAYRPILVGLPC